MTTALVFARKMHLTSSSHCLIGLEFHGKSHLFEYSKGLSFLCYKFIGTMKLFVRLLKIISLHFLPVFKTFIFALLLQSHCIFNTCDFIYHGIINFISFYDLGVFFSFTNSKKTSSYGLFRYYISIVFLFVFLKKSN